MLKSVSSNNLIHRQDKQTLNNSIYQNNTTFNNSKYNSSFNNNNKNLQLSTFKNTTQNFQQELQQTRTKNFQKRDKRILRSKVINFLDNSLKNKCCKIISHNDRVKNIEIDRQKEVQKEYELKVKQLGSNMPWKFGKFNSTEFVPSLRKYQKNNFKVPEDEVYNDPKSQYYEIQEAFQKVTQNLSAKQILEIGEYPQYFIKKNNHKQNKEFLSSDIWDDLGSKKEQNVKKKVQNVLRKSYSSKFFQTQQSQFSKQSEEIQNRLSTLEPLEVKQHQFKYRQQLKDLRLQQLNEERLMKQQMKQQINRARSEEFKYRQYQEKVLQDSKKIEVMTKFQQKMTQAQKIQENIELTKKAASQQVKELENQKLQQAKQIRAQKKEEDDIQQMNLQLRAVCLEQSVENNVKKELKRKLGQVDHLKKIYKYKEPYIADYLKTGVNFKNQAQESQDNYY